jgi:4-amino-4-deoxy-L-arabinose transferase-like glycosyltransferase
MAVLAPAADARARSGRGEVVALGAAIALGLAVRVVYLVLTRHLPLAGDEIEYDIEGRFIAGGHFFWSFLPFGIAHATAIKAPLYPLWVGLWYAVLGHHPVAVRALQIPLGVATITLSWLLARRLFGRRVAFAAAVVVALYPLAFQYEELLFSESLATPLTILALLLVLTGRPTPRRAAGFGAVLGIALLVRPSSVFLIAAALAAWSVGIGWRGGIRLTAIGVLLAALVLSPWAIRNAAVEHGFVPLSLEEPTVAIGTYNDVAARDPVFPYAWRPLIPGFARLFPHPVSDLTYRSRLIHKTLDYIQSHPSSVAATFFWNGMSRLWDIRRRSRSLTEVRFEGRSRALTQLGLDAYDVLLPLALIGLWRARRRRLLIAAIAASALAASLVYTIASGTRYRAPLEPVIAVLACAGVLGTNLLASEP